jgi:hypothetical protein
MADPDLTESAWQKAKNDAWGAIKTPTFGIGAAIVGLLFAAAALIASEGQPASTQAGATVLCGAASIGITLVFILLFQLVAAPVRQRDALRAAWETPEIETVNVGLSLRNLHRKGTELVHRYSGLGTGKPEEEEIEQWADGVVAFLAKQIPDDSTKAFLAAGESEPGAVRRLSARLQALQQIIDGLG